MNTEFREQLRTVLAFAVFFVLLALLFGKTIAGIAAICWTDDDYSHGLLLPFIAAYLLWTKQEEVRAALFEQGEPEFSRSGLVLLLCGVFLAALGGITDILFAKWLALFPTVIGGLQLILGTRRAALFVMPIVLLFMAKPIPDSLVPKLFFPLQVFAARVSASTLRLLDVPVYLRGNIIEIPHMSLMVEEACSGIRSLMALLTVALIVVLLVPLRNWMRLLILAVSVVTAVALNVLRIALTGVLAHFVDPSTATGFFHTFSGLIVFVLGLAIVYGFAALLACVASEKPIEEKPA